MRETAVIAISSSVRPRSTCRSGRRTRPRLRTSAAGWQAVPVNAQGDEVSIHDEGAWPTGWVTTPVTADMLRGALDIKRTTDGVLPHRLPVRARAQIPDDQLAVSEAQPSGVRLVFRTRARNIHLDVRPTKLAYKGAPPRPGGVYDLLVDGRLAGRASASGGNVRTTDMTTGSVQTEAGPIGTLEFPECPSWRPERRTSRSDSRTTRSQNWSQCVRTPPSSPRRRVPAESGCTMAARSATARTLRVPRRRGRRWRPQAAGWT